MEEPLRISTRGVTISPAEERAIWREARTLEQCHHRLIGCRILIEPDHRYPADQPGYAVRVDVQLPGTELVVTLAAHQELGTAIRLAFQATRAQVTDYARRARGDLRDRHQATGV